MAGGITVVVMLGMTLSLVISATAIMGGRHLMNASSRNWTIAGGIACCMIPLAWPLGAIVGIGAIVVMFMENDASRLTSAGIPAVTQNSKPSGPQISAMAVIAAVLVSLPLVMLGLALLVLI